MTTGPSLLMTVTLLPVGDRASFPADVLRVLPSGSLLLMVQANGIKLTVAPDALKGGAKLKGGDKATLMAAVWALASILDV